MNMPQTTVELDGRELVFDTKKRVDGALGE
jgi:hypothetical protein